MVYLIFFRSNQTEDTTDPVIINALMQICKTMHDSVKWVSYLPFIILPHKISLPYVNIFKASLFWKFVFKITLNPYLSSLIFRSSFFLEHHYFVSMFLRLHWNSYFSHFSSLSLEDQKRTIGHLICRFIQTVTYVLFCIVHFFKFYLLLNKKFYWQVDVFIWCTYCVE